MKFLIGIFFAVCAAVTLLAGLALNLAFQASVGWGIAVLCAVGFVTAVAELFTRKRGFALLAVAVSTGLICLITHMHVTIG